MEITKKAIMKIVSSYGAHILNRKNVFFILLEDMVPGQVEDLQFIKMIYTDEIGHILSEASQVPFSDKEQYYKKIDNYLQKQRGLMEPTRMKFINIFSDVFGVIEWSVQTSQNIAEAFDQNVAETLRKPSENTNGTPQKTIQKLIRLNPRFCKFCGAQLKKGTEKFCPLCGKSLYRK